MPTARKRRLGGRSGSRAARSSRRRSTGPARSRLRQWLLRIGLGLLVIWLLGCYLVLVEPTVNKPARVDAILVLGPPDVDGRAEAGYALARANYAGTVVVSVQSDRQQQLKSACRNQNSGYQVICFQPDPGTTRGEAREIGKLARAHHWSSIIVITSTYHVSRARMIIERCMPGTVLMVAAPGKPALSTWLRQFFYQSAAYVKAVASPGC
jgi:uncharacterized SAM-binding protein YcdF (DUF218 family)